jgi:hypothetical protein
MSCCRNWPSSCSIRPTRRPPRSCEHPPRKRLAPNGEGQFQCDLEHRVDCVVILAARVIVTHWASNHTRGGPESGFVVSPIGGKVARPRFTPGAPPSPWYSTASQLASVRRDGASAVGRCFVAEEAIRSGARQR